MSVYTNSQGEMIEVRECVTPEFQGQHCLLIHTDGAIDLWCPHLLDQGTAEWLTRVIWGLYPDVIYALANEVGPGPYGSEENV